MELYVFEVNLFILYVPENENEAQLLIHSNNINAMDENGNSALMLAAERGDNKNCFWCSKCSEIIFTLNVTGLERTVQKLIDSGAVVNALNKFNLTALMFATQSGYYCFENSY